MQVGAAAQHEHIFGKQIGGDAESRQGEQGSGGSTAHGAEHVFGDGDVFAGGAGGTGTERKIPHLAFPGYIFDFVETEVPPLFVHGVVVKYWYGLLKMARRFFRKGYVFKLIVLPKSGFG